jgi:hypothetical protein
MLPWDGMLWKQEDDHEWLAEDRMALVSVFLTFISGFLFHIVCSFFSCVFLSTIMGQSCRKGRDVVEFGNYKRGKKVYIFGGIRPHQHNG